MERGEGDAVEVNDADRLVVVAEMSEEYEEEAEEDAEDEDDDEDEKED